MNKILFRDICENYDEIMLSFIKRYTPINDNVTIYNYRSISALLPIIMEILNCRSFYDNIKLKDLSHILLSDIDYDNTIQKDFTEGYMILCR